MVTNRRARPTIRCLTEDMGLELPGLQIDLGDIEDAWLDELRRIASTSPRSRWLIRGTSADVSGSGRLAGHDVARGRCFPVLSPVPAAESG
ncbi:MAG: hypothetical protein ACRDPY_47005, partial [Streptosporangiaceae bacterium]